MKIVYIAHPISGDVINNLGKIRDIVRNINLTEPDVVPFVPYYADCIAMDDSIPEERARGIANDTAILKSGAVNELWLFGDRISNGMRAEIDLVMPLNIDVLPKTLETEQALRDLGYRLEEII